MLLAACSGDDLGLDPTQRDYRQDMRSFVQSIATYTRSINPNFVVIPQNGHQLLTQNGDAGGAPTQTYIAAIDGVGREDLFYGYTSDNTATPDAERNAMIAFMDLAESNGIQVLVTDYCWTPSLVDDSYTQNSARGYISFAADHRELDDIPTYPPQPYQVHSGDVTTLSQAKNFLYLLNLGSFANEAAFLNALRATDYDLLIIDLFYDGTEPLTSAEVASLKVKANGGSRRVIAYMSIGEAENYRFYWRPDWRVGSPSWLVQENPNWPGNFKVQYWETGWQSIIFGGEGSYLKRILDAGFDGVYLDIIDAFEYFESL